MKTSLTSSLRVSAKKTSHHLTFIKRHPHKEFYDALHFLRDRVRTELVREEAFANVMAEAKGRLTNQPAFVLGQGAWVLGNASIGIMQAHLGCSPMVILVIVTDEALTLI